MSRNLACQNPFISHEIKSILGCKSSRRYICESVFKKKTLTKLFALTCLFGKPLFLRRTTQGWRINYGLPTILNGMLPGDPFLPPHMTSLLPWKPIATSSEREHWFTQLGGRGGGKKDGGKRANRGNSEFHWSSCLEVIIIIKIL